MNMLAAEDMVAASSQATTLTEPGRDDGLANRLEKVQVDLRFTRSPAGSSYLSRQLAGYPYHVGRLLKKSGTPEHMAVTFLQCTSGGLFEHDRIRLCLHAEPGAVAQVRHAAATVVHSMTTGLAQSQVEIKVEAGAYLEYAANATILFPQASLVNRVDLTVHAGGMAVVSEAYLTHAPSLKAGEAYQAAFDRLDASTTVYTERGKLLMRDRLVLSGELLQRKLSGITAGFDTHGGIYIVMPGHSAADYAELADIVAQATASVVAQDIGMASVDASQVYAGSGALPNACGVFVRVLAKGSEPLRQVVDAVTAAVRERYAGQEQPANLLAAI